MLGAWSTIRYAADGASRSVTAQAGRAAGAVVPRSDRMVDRMTNAVACMSVRRRHRVPRRHGKLRLVPGSHTATGIGGPPRRDVR